ncbi:MAG: OmpA family protein [Planctomycetaceae bacterium]
MRTLNPFSPKHLAWSAALLGAVTVSGCRAVPYSQMRQAQMQAMQMRQQNRQLAGQLQQSQQMASQLQMENQQLQVAASQAGSGLDIANQRLLNLTNERGQLHEKYKALMAGFPSGGPMLPGSAIERLRALTQRYPDFEFDPVSGLCKFNNDLLFASGSDALRPESQMLLREFTQIMNDTNARDLKVLVVGHTDSQRIAKETTKVRHPTNWDLSAHRATAVVKQLAANGLHEERLGIAGYSLYQPKRANSSEEGRQQNRRVEIYVLAQDAALASADRFPN